MQLSPRVFEMLHADVPCQLQLGKGFLLVTAIPFGGHADYFSAPGLTA
jgi:hypothetical protein